MRDVFDQHADRADDVAVDHPQGEHADQQRRGEHDQRADKDGPVGGAAEDRRLLVTLLAQANHQAGHLLTGGTVNAFDGHVTGNRIATGGNVSVTAFAVGHAEGAVLVAQSVDLGFGRGVQPVHCTQAAEGVLHLAFLVFELRPELVAVGRLFAAQQHVLPFLHLNLELQVGLIDQLRGVQRPLKQTAIGVDVAGQELETRQGNQHDQHEAAAEQREDLQSQGFRHRRISKGRTTCSEDHPEFLRLATSLCHRVGAVRKRGACTECFDPAQGFLKAGPADPTNG